MKTDLIRLTNKNNLWKQERGKIPKESIESIHQDFCVNYAHDSTTIEGNTLTLIKTKAVLEDNISIGAKI